MSLDQESAISCFWGAVVPPKSSILLDFPSETVLKITSLSFDQIVSQEPSKITAIVRTLLIEDENSVVGDEVENYKTDEVSFGSLFPGQTEQVSVNIQFSPLDIIELFNSGPNEVHLSGYLTPIDDEDEDLLEEEEEEESAAEEEGGVTADEIQRRFSEMAKNQPPKPEPKKK
ncbi:hypothetical protein TRFO_34028 [Tritrichomonas foetus]|uniref:Nucleoplasmin-like domain-containing protein n=1 Tax=Tritrichomonas foetus TaxID=1144522 RepID=A0A1J4JQL1_9EUKA|nr:hypothetical protein TRFO_34028 [Tritrichomonas foetus]|eukprot:OHS99524.1 hypothetical protein TRFO_34028 [Tritrichomonas foetus]